MQLHLAAQKRGSKIIQYLLDQSKQQSIDIKAVINAQAPLCMMLSIQPFSLTHKPKNIIDCWGA